MAENNTLSASNATGSNNESDQALIAFKQLINSRLPILAPETAGWKDENGHLVHETSDPLDSGYLYILDNFILDPSKIAQNAALQELVDQYNTLPESIKTPVEIKRTFFEKPSNNITSSNQAQAIINLAQDYLNIEETSDGKIDETTGRALRKTLEDWQRQNPDIGVEFSPQNNDSRTIDFLNALTQKRMGSAGTDPRDLNQTLIHLWAMEKDAEVIPGQIQTNVGAVVSLRNMMELMVNGTLPSGSSAARPATDAPWDQDWTNNASPDVFFSNQTYAALASTTSRNTLGTVHTATLFAEIPSNPNGALLKQMAEDIGLDTNKTIFTEIEVGRIAAEMLTYKAKELCIDEPDINRAIHSGQFMPNLTDLLIVERGFGFPEGHNTGAAVWEHQSNSFGQRYGMIDKEFLDSLDSDNIMHGRKFQMDIHQSPSSYFTVYRGVSDFTQDLTPYERMREEVFLPSLADFIADGSTCGSAPKATQDSDCTVEGVVGDGPCGDSTPEVTDDLCTVEGIVGKGPCSNEFDTEAENPETTDEKIQSNAESTTGNDYECFVEDNVTSDCDQTLGNTDPTVKAP
ncbi:MAG: hypothetical protein COA45_03450 [Zetaproteobacteria bacterium]|nr:MAG: hypothetical protein COA45_03450 [Zetaproteobacteria bacterium]